MSAIMIFQPVIRLTPEHSILSDEPAQRMKGHMRPGCFVMIVQPEGTIVEGYRRQTVEVAFPRQTSTDLVSPEYLHEMDDLRVNKFIKRKENQNGLTN